MKIKKKEWILIFSILFGFSSGVHADDRCGIILDPHQINRELIEFINKIKLDVIGQDDAVVALANQVNILSAGIRDPKKPLGRFLFLGPTGVGKTELAEAFTKALGGAVDESLIKFEGAEYSKGHEVSKITGATASYAGYGAKTNLHPMHLKKSAIPFKMIDGSILNVNSILVDEVEKGHEDFYRLWLGPLDKGSLTLGENTKSDMKNTFFMFTSNLGAKEVNALLEKKAAEHEEKQKDSPNPVPFDFTARNNPELQKEIFKIYDLAIATHFSPEFLGRFNGIFYFLHLGPQELDQILQKFLRQFQLTILHSPTPFAFEVSTEARLKIIQSSTDILKGARDLSKSLEREVFHTVAKLITTRQVLRGDILSLSVENEKYVWKIKQHSLNKDALLAWSKENYGISSFDEDPASTSKKVLNFAESMLDDLRDEERRSIYISIKKDPINIEEAIADGQSVRYSVKYAKIDNEFYEIKFNRITRITKIESIPEIPSSAAPFYTEKNVFLFSSELVNNKWIIKPL